MIELKLITIQETKCEKKPHNNVSLLSNDYLVGFLISSAKMQQFKDIDFFKDFRKSKLKLDMAAEIGLRIRQIENVF